MDQTDSWNKMGLHGIAGTCWVFGEEMRPLEGGQHGNEDWDNVRLSRRCHDWEEVGRNEILA